MKTYTLHVPANAVPGDPEALEKADLVPDRFAWLAFTFTFLWFLFHRLWLAGIAVAVLLAVLHGALDFLNLHPVAGVATQFLVAVLIGLEANSLRRWTYARRGRPARDLVLARSSGEAEAKAFARWLQPAPRRTPTVSRGEAGAYRGDPVLGLFPEPERPR